MLALTHRANGKPIVPTHDRECWIQFFSFIVAVVVLIRICFCGKRNISRYFMQLQTKFGHSRILA